jgi:aminopeptidase-like protein
MAVEDVENGTAYINIEPFDDAFNQSNVDETIDRAKRILLKRKKAIQKSLDVVRLSVTAYDEWTMKDAFVVELDAEKVIDSVN